MHAFASVRSPRGTHRSWQPLSDFEQAATQSTMPLGCCADPIWTLNIRRTTEPKTAGAVRTCLIIVSLFADKMSKMDPPSAWVKTFRPYPHGKKTLSG
jgi:hypothetical protein